MLLEDTRMNEWMLAYTLAEILHLLPHRLRGFLSHG